MSFKHLTAAAAVALTILSGVGMAPVAHAAPLGGNAYYFGDSLTDCCWTQRYTNGGQPNWADQLSAQLGTTNTPSKSTNFAIGGAQSGTGNANNGIANTIAANNNGALSGFLPQVSRFTAQGNTVGPNDFAGIWIGTNDIWPSSYAPGEVVPGNTVLGTQPSASALTSYIIGNIQSGINQLKADGISNIVLLSPYDLAQSAIVPAADKALATIYSDALTAAESQLYTPGVNTYFVNVENLLRQAQANPGAYGFLHTTATDSCSANNCTSQPLSVQNTYVFNDIIHTTSAFDQLIANTAVAIINAGQTIPAPVPEPASTAMLLAGLAGLVLARRRMQA